jgi:hypothetical protein
MEETMANGPYEHIAAASELQHFTFGLDPLVDGQTDAALTPTDSAVAPVMPFAGSIVGIAARADEAAGAGAISFDALVGATQQGLDLALAVDDTTTYKRYQPGLYPFAAGAVLGASYTSGTLTTNAGVRVDVYVLFDDVRG